VLLALENAVDRMTPRVAAASRRWQLGRIERDQKEVEDQKMVARYLAKVDAEAARRHRKPEPVVLPPVPGAWAEAMRRGSYL
jgi:hypothetical protein